MPDFKDDNVLKYDKYRFWQGAVIPVVGDLKFRISDDGGSTFDSEQTDYVFKPKSADKASDF